MSQSASQAAAFYKDVAKYMSVWCLRDKDGIPAPKGDKKKRSMPFWSTQSRVNKIINSVTAYSEFEAFEISWDAFRDRWLPGLEKDGLLVGVNWSGDKAVGYDVEPKSVKENIEYHIAKTNNT
jgi:hypothetical protein